MKDDKVINDIESINSFESYLDYLETVYGNIYNYENPQNIFYEMGNKLNESIEDIVVKKDNGVAFSQSFYETVFKLSETELSKLKRLKKFIMSINSSKLLQVNYTKELINLISAVSVFKDQIRQQINMLAEQDEESLNPISTTVIFYDEMQLQIQKYAEPYDYLYNSVLFQKEFRQYLLENKDAIITLKNENTKSLRQINTEYCQAFIENNTGYYDALNVIRNAIKTYKNKLKSVVKTIMGLPSDSKLTNEAVKQFKQNLGLPSKIVNNISNLSTQAPIDKYINIIKIEKIIDSDNYAKDILLSIKQFIDDADFKNTLSYKSPLNIWESSGKKLVNIILRELTKLDLPSIDNVLDKKDLVV